MKTATRIKRVGDTTKQHHEVYLYQLSEPLGGYEYVISSAVDHKYNTNPAFKALNSLMIALQTLGDGNPDKYSHDKETFIFGCDSEGNCTDYSELDGSTGGIWDCNLAIRNAGYQVIDSNAKLN